ncbi:ATP-grasp domain-containing protein [Caldisericum sp.]|uniref:ATP-grasp domain-containing protein n=1 Tax=Caldisericum sp. TaxID=2499687 RepID=UPI003D0F6BF6
MKVLFTSAGRRVELIELFKKEGFVTFSVDSDPTAPSLYKADGSFIVPSVIKDPESYIESLLALCRKEDIDVIVPLIDPELPVLAKEKNEFIKAGTIVLISSYYSVNIASDKYETFEFLKAIGLPVPETIILSKLSSKEITLSMSMGIFPAILKPRHGSASQGVVQCPNYDCLNLFISKLNPSDYVLQKFVSGEEVTIDLFGDGTGRLISAVQRKRLKVRGGEVERGITVKYPELFDDVIKFSEAFKPFGPVNIQCFYNGETKERFYTEINARFGGGYPLSYYAGANFIRYLKMLLKGKKIGNALGEDYEKGLVMARFDEAVYIREEDLLKINDSSF